ncbi:hypothetical protein D3C86_1925190 [compost metagenome]
MLVEVSQDQSFQMFKLSTQVTKHIFDGFSNNRRHVRCPAFFQPVFFAAAVRDKRITATQKGAEITNALRRRDPWFMVRKFNRIF